mmetsp:Transcript_68065/g.191867  ORF Transcript_68065/g.191867 Transcript_68065/m.191867 type:complete len:217 (-) Transcript_68065:104-754(-)
MAASSATGPRRDNLTRMSGTKPLHFKLVIVGDASVGKSSLAVRFAKGQFNDNQEPSIGATFMTQGVHLDSATVMFEIWDTAGQERYKALAPMYYRGAAVAVVVFDITKYESFETAKTWVLEIRACTDALIALAGNKSDLGAERVVQHETAREYADAENILYMDTSAKSGSNVNEFFHEIAVQLPKKPKEDSDKKGFRFAAGSPDEQGSEGCCSMWG